MLVVLSVNAQHGNEGDNPFGDSPSSQPSNLPPQQVEDAVQQASSLPDTTTNQKVTAHPNGGELNLPAGSQVSIQNGNIKASQIDSARTKQGTLISSCTDTFIARNGVVTADHCNNIDVGPVKLRDVTNVQIRGDTLTFDAASSGIIESPTRIPLPELGQSKIQFNTKAITDAQLRFTDTSQPFDFQNPLAFDQGTTTNPLEVLDSDGDGIADSVERALGTNINSMDTDGDRLSDQQEFLRYTTKPTVQNTFPISINPPFTTDAGFVEWANEHVFEVEGNVVDHFRTVNAEPPFVWVDRDGDGITDVIESMLGLIGSFLLTTF